MRIFLKQRVIADPNSPPIHCAADGCGVATRNGKRFCADHIHQMDYARRVLKEIERRETEVRKLTNHEPLPLNSHLVAEAHALLWEHQQMTAPGLTRHIPITHEQAETLLKALAHHGLAELHRSYKGLEARCTTSSDQIPPILPKSLGPSENANL